MVSSEINRDRSKTFGATATFLIRIVIGSDRRSEVRKKLIDSDRGTVVRIVISYSCSYSHDGSATVAAVTDGPATAAVVTAAAVV